MFFQSIGILFKNFKIMIPAILSIIAFFIISLFFSEDVVDAITYSSYGNFSSIIMDVLGMLSLFIIISIVLSIIKDCWTIYTSILVLKNETFSMFDALKKSLKFFFRLLGVYALQVAIWFITFFLFIILFSGDSSGFFMFLGLLVYIFYATIFIPISYIVIKEDIGVIQGFSKGIKFGVKNFYSILGVNVLIVLIFFIILSIFAESLMDMVIYQDSSGIQFIEIVLEVMTAIAFASRGIYILKLHDRNNLCNAPLNSSVDSTSSNDIQESNSSNILTSEDTSSENDKDTFENPDSKDTN